MMEQPPSPENAMEFKKDANSSCTQATNSIPEIKKIFGTMGNIWKLFFYSPKKAESLKAVQSVLKLPERNPVIPDGSHTNAVYGLFTESFLP